jgi:predicted cupin superfamily sugar epimerase
MIKINAGELRRCLQLQAHPEGGYYAEVYRSEGLIPALALTQSHGGFRPFMTSIYFLLEPGQVSKLHRLKSDEIWYYHAGSPLTIHLLGDVCHRLQLGPDPAAGQLFQRVVPAGTWFGATVDDDSEPSLVGCAVAPGFDFADFELAQQNQLLQQFPQHEKIIRQLT